MHKRVILITSPLQVLNARSAINNLEKRKNVEEIILICHATTGKNANVIKIIKRLASKLDFDKIYNISEYLHDKSKINLKKSLWKKIINIKSNIKKNNFQIIRQTEVLYNFFKDKNILPDEIFLRKKYNDDEIIISNLLMKKYTKFYFIEDGTADYNFRLNFKLKFKNKIKKIIYKNFISLPLSIIFFENLRDIKKIFFLKKIKAKKKFLNLSRNGYVSTKKNFIYNLKKVSEKRDKLINQIVNPEILIIGTIHDIGVGFTAEDEINTYNKLIGIIRNKYGVTKNKIFYKPHPRISKANFNKKVNSLGCMVIEANEDRLVEEYFITNNIKAIYSVGSTAMLYAKEIFGIDCYVIDLSNYKDLKRNMPLRKNMLDFHNRYKIKSVKL